MTAPAAGPASRFRPLTGVDALASQGMADKTSTGLRTAAIAVLAVATSIGVLMVAAAASTSPDPNALERLVGTPTRDQLIGQAMARSVLVLLPAAVLALALLGIDLAREIGLRQQAARDAESAARSMPPRPAPFVAPQPTPAVAAPVELVGAGR